MKSTHLGQNAAYLDRVVQRSPALIYVFSQEVGQNEYSNENVTKVLGYTREEILQLGLDLMTDNLHPEDMARVYEHIEGLSTLADGEVRTIEYRMRHRDGHWVWLLSHDTVFQRDENGSVTHHIGTAFDVTASKTAQTSDFKLTA